MVWIQGFPSSSSYHSKDKESTLPYNLLIAWTRIVVCLPFKDTNILRNAESFVLDLNSCHRVHFVGRHPLHYIRLLQEIYECKWPHRISQTIIIIIIIIIIYICYVEEYAATTYGSNTNLQQTNTTAEMNCYSGVMSLEIVNT